MRASRRDPSSPRPPRYPATPTIEQPSSFVAGRYAVRRFLGEGGKKRVYLAHDERLDRDVAFALIKTDGLDEVGRERIVREAQAMGRMGAHPHIVGIYEIGEEAGAPYVVTELLGGGDVEGALAAEGGPLPLATHARDREGRGARAGVRAPAGRGASRPQAGQRLAHRRRAWRRSATSGSPSRSTARG